MPKPSDKSLAQGSQAEVDAFLAKVASLPPAKTTDDRGRLIFAMDATASREPTWDRACHLQGEMFEETAALGGLDVQLAYYRGFREFHASPWHGDANSLLAQMTSVRCAGGTTQIERLLDHATAEARDAKVDAMVFVGDCFEEDVDRVCNKAGELGLLGVPVFIFHEGMDPTAASAFRHITKLTRGAYCRFDATSAKQLRDLLRAVAVYAAGGRRALAELGRTKGGVARELTHQLEQH